MKPVSRRSFLQTSVTAGAVAIFAPAALAQLGAIKPNIIWMIADDLGGKDLGCYGHPTLRTPNINSLAAEGLRFTHAFVTTSSCSPSRASMFTGKYPHSTGAENLHDPLPADQKIAPELLKAVDYYSGSVGKFHLGTEAAKKLDKVENDLNAWKAFLDDRPKSRPFFLSIGFSDAHRPFDRGCIDQPYEHSEIMVPPYLPDIPEAHEELAGYYDEISRMDRVVGEVLQYLERHDLAKNTVVVFVSDNGMPFPRAKTTLYDSGIQTPLLMRMPGTIQAGMVYPNLVSTIDIAPTMLELAGVFIPPDVQGKSIIKQIQDPVFSRRDVVFAERNWHDLDDHSRAVRRYKVKYIRNSFPEKPLENSADSTVAPLFQKMLKMRDSGTLTKEQMLLFRSRRAKEELYDLEHDPWEFHNLAYHPAYQSALNTLRGDLDKWIEETNDIPPEKALPDEFHPETGERIRPPHQNQ